MRRNRSGRRFKGRVGNLWTGAVLVGALIGWSATFVSLVSAAEGALETTSSKNAAQTASPPRLLLLEFATRGEENCRRVEPLLNEMRRKNYPIRRVDRDADDSALFERFSVRSTPTFVLLVDGEEFGRLVATDEADSVLRNQLLRLFERGREELAEMPRETNKPGSSAPKKTPLKAPSAFFQSKNKPKKSQNAELVRGQSGLAAFSGGGASGGTAGRNSTPAAQDFSARGVVPDSPSISPIDAATVCIVVGSQVDLANGALGASSIGSGVVVHFNADCGEALVVSAGGLFCDERGAVANAPISVVVADAATGLTATVPGENVYCDPDADVALVAFDVPSGLSVRPATFLPPNAEPIQVGETLTSGARPESGAASALRHRVLTTDQVRFRPRTGDSAGREFAYLQVSSAPEKTRRGGGIFAERNGRVYLAGVCVAGNAERDDAFFLPISVVEQTLQIRENLAVVCRDQRAGKFDYAPSVAANASISERNVASESTRSTNRDANSDSNFRPISSAAFNSTQNLARGAASIPAQNPSFDSARIASPPAELELLDASLAELRRRCLEGAEVVCVVNWDEAPSAAPRETEVLRLPKSDSGVRASDATSRAKRPAVVDARVPSAYPEIGRLW